MKYSITEIARLQKVGVDKVQDAIKTLGFKGTSFNIDQCGQIADLLESPEKAALAPKATMTAEEVAELLGMKVESVKSNLRKYRVDATNYDKAQIMEFHEKRQAKSQERTDFSHLARQGEEVKQIADQMPSEAEMQEALSDDDDDMEAGEGDIELYNLIGGITKLIEGFLDKRGRGLENAATAFMNAEEIYKQRIEELEKENTELKEAVIKLKAILGKVTAELDKWSE